MNQISTVPLFLIHNIDPLQIGLEQYSRHHSELQVVESFTSARSTHRFNDASSTTVAAEERADRGKGGDLRGKSTTRKTQETNSDISHHHTRLEASWETNNLYRPHQRAPDRDAQRTNAVNKLGGIGTESKDLRQIEYACKR